MKTLYLDCGMGAAGDMLAGALYDLLSEEQRAEFQNIAAAFSAVGLNVRCAAAEKCGIRGIHFAVEYMNTFTSMSIAMSTSIVMNTSITILTAGCTKLNTLSVRCPCPMQ